MTASWPTPGARPMCGVIGWPVTYSLSPAIHNAAFRDLGMDWEYVHLPVPPGELPEAMERLTAEGFSGANVTIPHKVAAANLAVWLSEDADLLNAVNTLAPTNGGLSGHNTDAPGFSRFLEEDAGWDPRGRSALIFGAGGAARACALSLMRGGIGSLTVATREPATADLLSRMVTDLGGDVAVVRLDGRAPEADLIVNATPLGRSGERVPLPDVGPDQLVVDLLYSPAMTPMLAAAAEAGARTFDGLGLLVHQAALSFELWTGRVPQLEVMRAAASEGLEGP